MNNRISAGRSLIVIAKTVATIVVIASSGFAQDSPRIVPFQPDIQAGGRAVTVAIDPSYPPHAIAASESGGLFVTYDQINWRHLRDCPMHNVSDVKFAPRSPAGQVVVIATGTGDGRTSSSGGIWRSTDGGVLWRRPAGSDPTCTAPRYTYGIAFSPDGARVYVGTECGIAISTNYGVAWFHRTEGGPVWAIAAQNSGSEDVVDYFTPRGSYKRLGVSGAGVVREISSTGPPGYCKSVRAVAIPPTQPNVVFVAASRSGTSNILYEGDYDGAGRVTWTQVSPTAWDGRFSRGAWVAITQWDRGNPTIYDVYASDGYRFFRQTCNPVGTTGSGCTFDRWLGVNVPPLLTDPGYSQRDNNGIAFRPDTGRPAYVAADGGLYTPTTAPEDRFGLQWEWISNNRRGFNALQIYQVTGQIIAGRCPPSGSGSSDPYGHTDLYFGTQDNAYQASGDGGVNWPYETGNEGGSIFVARYARASGRDGINVVVRDDAYYKTITSDAYWQNERSWQGPDGSIGHPILISPKVYLQPGTNHLPRTDGLINLNLTPDLGRTWQRITAISPNGYGELRVSSNAGGYVTIYGARARDGGRFGLWKMSGIRLDGSVSLPAPPSEPLLPISRADVGLANLGLSFDAVFAVDPNNPAHLLAADVGTKKAMVSRNGGLVWLPDEQLTDLVTGLDSATHVQQYQFAYSDNNGYTIPQITAIAFDPYYRDRILVGTESAGIFRSTDGGMSWAAIPGSTEATKITSFFFIENNSCEPNDTVIVSTYSRGLWKLILPPGARRAGSAPIRSAGALPASLPFGLPLGVATELAQRVFDANTGLSSPKLLLNPSDNPQQRWFAVAGGKLQDIILEEGAVVSAVAIDSGRLVASSADGRPIVPGCCMAVAETNQIGAFAGCPACDSIRKNGGSVFGFVLEDGTLRAVLGGVAPLPGESTIAAFNPPPSDPPPAPEDIPPSGPQVQVVNAASPQLLHAAGGDSLALYGSGFCGAAGCSPVVIQIGGITVNNGITVSADGTFQTTVKVPELGALTLPGLRSMRSDLRVSQNGAGNQTLAAGTMLLVSSLGSDPIVPSSEPPGLVSAATVDGTTIGLRFDRTLSPESAANLANYSIQNGAATVLSAELRPDGKSVQLSLAMLVPPTFMVSVTNILDLSSNVGGGTVVGTVPKIVLHRVDLGQPRSPGSAFSWESNSTEITSSGTQFGGQSDQFTFLSRETTGDFDLEVQITPVSGPPGSFAGLVARESEELAGAKCVGLFFTPVPATRDVDGGRLVALVRRASGANSEQFAAMTGPGGSPSPRLRLKRQGHLFTTYTRLDDGTWTQVGQVDTSAYALNSALSVGLVTGSGAPSQTAMMDFHDFGNTPSCLFLEAPPNIVTNCTGSDGAEVNFTFSAANRCSPSDLFIWSDWTSGSTFPPGTTTVNCLAVGSGQTERISFTVTVSNCSIATAQGVPIRLLGNATIEGRSDGSLRLSGLGVPGQDGVRLAPGAVTGLRADFDHTQEAAPLAAGSEFRAISLDGDGAPIATLRMVRNSSFGVLELIPDFNPLNSPRFGIRLYNGSKLLYESQGRTSPPPSQFPITEQIFTTAAPQAIRVSIRPGLGPVFEYLLGARGSVQVSGNDGGNFSADRLEIMPSGPGIPPVDWLSGLDLSFSGVSERIITGVALTKFGQEIRASQGVAMAGLQGALALGYVNVTALNPPGGDPVGNPDRALVWNTANPVGYFGDSSTGNPSGYKGYWEGINPLGLFGGWDLEVDLTDNASMPLGWAEYRPGKSSAELAIAFGSFLQDAKLRVVAGGVAEANPAALTVEMGALVFERKAGRVELGAEIPGTNSVPTGTGQRLEVTLADGTVRSFQGVPEGMRVSWDWAASMPTGRVVAFVGLDGGLTLGLRFPGPGASLNVQLPDSTPVPATAMTWRSDGGQTRLDGGASWLPGSLRGLLLVGSNAPPVTITGLTSSTDNPTPATYFAEHQVKALGNATFRSDAYGSLVLSGLTQTGEDGVALKGFSVSDAAAPSQPPLRLTPGFLPFLAQSSPPAGTYLDLRVLSEGNSVPNAVLAGQSLSDGGPIFLGVRFPDLQAKHHTLRVFRGDQVVFDQSGRPNEAPTERGNFAPNFLPDEISARIVNGRFTWILDWNRSMGMSIYNQPAANPFQGDRVEIAAEDATQPYPSTENTFELRAGPLDTLRLLNLGNRSAPAGPTFNFDLDAGRLNLNWSEVVSGFPKLQIAPRVTGPWQNLSLGKLVAPGQRSFALLPAGPAAFTRLVTRPATEGCLSFSTETPGTQLNPWEFAGWTFERFNPDESHSQLNQIVELDGNHSLRFDGALEIQLPAPAAAVDLGFQRLGGALTIIAYDDLGEVSLKVVEPQPTTGGAEAETIDAPENRPLRRLRLLGSGQPVDLRELCLRAFPFHDVAQSRSCLPLRTAALGTIANPWIQGDLAFTAHTADGSIAPSGLISLFSNSAIAGYDVAYQTELSFAHPSQQVEIEFISASGSIDFQAYDELGAALPKFHLGRSTSSYGETAVFTGDQHPISRVVVTSPAGNTRLMKICGGPVPMPFCREVGNITVRPTQNPQPAGDMIWAFYDATHLLASSALRNNAVDIGLDLTAETDIDFATDQLWVELQISVDANGATIAADAATVGGNPAGSLPSASYPAGVHTLRITDSCGDCGVGARLRRVQVRLTAGHAIVTRVCTPFRDNE